MQDMFKCRTSDAPLPYDTLITQIMQYGGVDLSPEASTI